MTPAAFLAALGANSNCTQYCSPVLGLTSYQSDHVRPSELLQYAARGGSFITYVPAKGPCLSLRQRICACQEGLPSHG